MRFGVHLPQFGRIASPKAIQCAAVQAEQLGFDDVWVSDHLAIPADAAHVTPYFYEPVVVLTWAAAVTQHVGIGTTVLVLPYRHPLHLAKQLATLDRLSGARLTVGAASGWLEPEFNALGVPFSERGPRSDEALAVLRACWEQDPTSFRGATVKFDGLRVLPKPDRKIPIWVGGASGPALRRAVRFGDGWHGTFMSPEETGPILRQLRAERPEKEFTLSMRVAWDGLSDDRDGLRRRAEKFCELGIQHLLASPSQPELDGWLASVEALAKLFAEFR
jgi:probable F420-dependent oxidoreductase